MRMTVEFTPNEEALLRERASAAGKDLCAFVRDAALEMADHPSLAEILAPIHAATDRAGISVEDIDAMADRARNEARGR